MGKRIFTKTALPNKKVIKRHFYMGIKDTYGDRGVKTITIPILDVTNENFAEVKGMNNSLMMMGLSVAFMKKYCFSPRELEFLYFFIKNKFDGKFNGVNALFKHIREENIQYLRSAQGSKEEKNTMFFVFKNLENQRILIKKTNTEGRVTLFLNSELDEFSNDKKIEDLGESIKQTFLENKESVSPMLIDLAKKINNSLKSKKEFLEEI